MQICRLTLTDQDAEFRWKVGAVVDDSIYVAILTAIAEGHIPPLLFPHLLELSVSGPPGAPDQSPCFPPALLQLCASSALSMLPRAVSFDCIALLPNILTQLSENPGLESLVLTFDHLTILPPQASLRFHQLRTLSVSFEITEHIAEFFQCLVSSDPSGLPLREVRIVNWGRYPYAEDLTNTFQALCRCSHADALEDLCFVTEQFDPHGLSASELSDGGYETDEIPEILLPLRRHFSSLAALKLEGEVHPLTATPND